MRIFHKSLFEYLLDSSRSGDLRLDLGLAHEIVANHILRGRNIQDNWELVDFENFTYHCQYARLNDTLTHHLRSLACDLKITFPRSLFFSTSKPLQAILYFLQVLGRQDFDSSGHCYRKFVKKQTQCLRLDVPWSRRLKSMIRTWGRNFTVTSQGVRGYFLSSFDDVFQSFGYYILRDTNGLDGSSPIPALNTSVVKSIEQEHEMFSVYVKSHHQYPDTVISF